MNKTLATLLHGLVLAVVTAVATYVSGVDIGTIGTGYTALIAGAVVGIVSKLLGTLIAKLGPSNTND